MRKKLIKEISEELIKDEVEEIKKQEGIGEFTEDQKRRYWEHLKKEVEERAENIVLGYEHRGLTEKYFFVEFEKSEKKSKDQKDMFETLKEKKGLFVSGENGTGKTHAAMCAVKNGAVYKKLSDILRMIRIDFSQEQNIIDKLGTIDYLIIDEVGRSKNSDFEKNIFFEIIDARYNNCKETAIMTNLSFDAFCEEYGTSIIDRIRPKNITLKYSSFREEKLK